ncbi:hypothetical protein [Mycobacterium sp. MS1601]|mgnify:CR=1 FL=1|uniref:hypothetical protein n=1 Tax=Mycobacterium sp. MS1601 TaxID=1936029 RepID=UPI00178CBF76|nr:hypothetical protein [Mycobacterium sp. MS1601]
MEATKRSASEALDLTAEQGDELQIERFITMFRTRDYGEALEALFGRRDGNYLRRYGPVRRGRRTVVRRHGI